MMKVQLLLLLALAGPLCADPLPVSTVDTSSAPNLHQTTDTPTRPVVVQTAAPSPSAHVTSIPVVTGPPPTQPRAAAGVGTTETYMPSAPQTLVPQTTTPVAVTAAPVAVTAAPVAATAAPASTVPNVATDPPTKAPETTTQPASAAVPAETTEAMPTAENDVIVEDDIKHDLSTGQVIGIVIGALLAVAIVIAVAIAVLRRMGKYSP